MSLPRGRLTRRQILSGAAALPALAFAQKACAQTPTPTVIPTGVPDFELPEVLVPVPEDQLEWVVNKAEEDHQVADREKYERVARNLWFYFALGVDRAGKGDIGIPPEMEICKLGYVYQTGAALATNLHLFSPEGDHGETNWCAYRCGEHAATAARYQGKSFVDQDVYIVAWDLTYEETHQIFARIRSLLPESQGELSNLRLQLTPRLGGGC